jgi:hypothetical protein
MMPFVRSLFSAIAVAALVLSQVFAQGGRQQLGTTDIEKKIDWGVQFYDAISGTKKVDAKSLASICDLTSKFYVYRMTWDITETKKGGLDGAIEEFNKQVERAINTPIGNKNADNSAFQALWAKDLTARFRELTDLPLLDNARAILHGVQMFPALGKLKHEDTGVYFLELMKADDKKRPGQDAIRLWALRGLREMFPVQAWGEPQGSFVFSGKVENKRKTDDLDRIKTISDYIARPVPAPADPETTAAYIYLRRDAIETLAAAGWPAVNANKKYQTVEGPIATTLLKVLVPGNLTPESTLAERNEAALGLCRIKYVDTYDAKPTLYFIGKTLVEMAKVYEEDFTNKDKSRQPFAWKIQGERWRQALDAMSTSDSPFTRDTELKKAFDEFKRLALSEIIKSGMLVHGKIGNLLSVEQELNKRMPAPGDLKLFKGIEGPTVKWSGPAGA